MTDIVQQHPQIFDDLERLFLSIIVRIFISVIVRIYCLQLDNHVLHMLYQRF